MHELLSPAGDLQKLRIAFRYGADAVYIGVPQFSLRTRSNTITESDLAEGVRIARDMEKKIYVTVNNYPHQFSIEALKKHLEFLSTLEPDGIILADVGVLLLANKLAPRIPKHLSVQTSTVNIPSIQFWQSQGISRIILAREVSVDEVSKIHEEVPQMELEMFVHGSVCMAYSGRCLLSNFMTERDANRGICAHSCRWKYRISQSENRLYNPETHEKKAYLEETQRPGEIMPIEEDIHGTHIMSSRDMCMVNHLNRIIEAGVISLKIEGRNKTPYYLAIVTRTYRQALDNYDKGIPVGPELLEELSTTANRGFFEGFLNGIPGPNAQQYEENRSTSTQEFCGIVKEYDPEKKRVRFEIKNRIQKGSEISFLSPRIQDDITIPAEIFDLSGEDVEVVHGGAGDAWMSVDQEIEIATIMRQKVQNPGQICP